MAPPIELGPIGVSAQFRAAEFLRAATSFAGVLDTAVPDYGNKDLSAPLFERALLIHTYALLTVLGVPFEIRTKNSESFLEALWGREVRFLDGVMKSLAIDPMLHEAALQATAGITAIGGATGPEHATGAIGALPVLRGASEYAIDALARLLHDVYGGAKWIDPLQPDILGEYAVRKVFRNNFAALNAVLAR
jgi:hypothetical protein